MAHKIRLFKYFMRAVCNKDTLAMRVFDTEALYATEDSEVK